MNIKEVKDAIKKGYGKIAGGQSSCCYSKSCTYESVKLPAEITKQIGYSAEEINSVPGDANLGLGCGNPVAMASIKKGETILDLGSGPGLDCFLAANKTGSKGRVIGIDMTPEMIKKAKENAKKGNYSNVEFKLGEIENLPLEDSIIDLIISNCVINLSENKRKVFKEAYRVLKPGGRFMISDIVLLGKLPEPVMKSIEAYVGCISGAVMKDEYLKIIAESGFTDINIAGETHFPVELMLNDPTAKKLIENINMTADDLKKFGDSIISIKVSGTKTAA